MTPERYLRLRETLDRRQPDLTLITEQVHKPRNVAALVRTADAVGIHEMHMVWPYDHHRHYSGTAMGSDRWVNVNRHESMPSAITQLKNNGYKVYAAHFSDQAIDYREVDYTIPCALVMGNEKQGITDETAATVDEHVIVPMMGMVESFNVSVAAAIILAEAQRQRAALCMYDKVRLDSEEYWQTFFRWAHPKIAQYCHKKKLPYPSISEVDGEVVDPSAWYASVR